MIVKLTIEVVHRSSLTGFNESIVAQKYSAWREHAEPYCFPLCYDTAETDLEEILAEHERYLEGYYGEGAWEHSPVLAAQTALGLVHHAQNAFFVVN